MTDHAATAIASLGLWSRLSAPAIDPEEEARQWLSEAQVHATLALEAQTARLAHTQETANLIACLAAGFFIGHDHEDTAWADEVYPRLGLTPTTPNQEQSR